MRINTGMKVEARGKDSVMGGWRLGVVVWGNGHQYKIRWDGGDEVSGRIRRVSVRPPPPPLPVPADLEHGDLIEVFSQCLWKLAEFVRSSGDAAGSTGDEFTVKIVATPKIVTVPRSLVRVRQVLTDRDIWVATYKGEEIPGAREPTSRASAPKPRAHAGKKRGGQFAPPPPPVASAQWAKIKRSRHAMGGGYEVVRQLTREEIHSESICALEEEQEERYRRKYRKYHNHNVEMEVINVNEPNSAAAAAFGDKQKGMSGGEGGKSVSSAGSGSGSSSSRSRSEDSDGSSSSSDSDDGDHAAAAAAPSSPPRDTQGANQPPPPPQQPQRVKEEIAGAGANDDERTESRASARQQRRPAPPAPAAAVGQIHGLELDAYAALMKVFHATGALTWQKEELLTQLRLQLHITGDEHLKLIRALNGGGRRPPKPENVDA